MGDDNNDQLIQIVKVLGYEDLMKYMMKFDLKLDDAIKRVILEYNILDFIIK